MMTSKEKFLTAVKETLGEVNTISSKSIQQVLDNCSDKLPYPAWLTTPEYRIGRGLYTIPDLSANAMQPTIVENIIPMKKTVQHTQEDTACLIPEKDPNYIPWGFHSDLKNIIKSKIFYPMFICGESGFGKNMMIEQVCADLKRELIRFNFSIETDKVDLVGGPTLVDGNIIYNDGPVIKAMRQGAVLFLDEFSKGNPNTMLIMNGILEGKPYFNPHTSEMVYAKEGFNVIAASNSAGRGEDSGRFLEQILDTSLLERFPITVLQEAPSEKIELKILSNYLDDADFVEKLVKWARVIRKTYENGGIDELISIRRLVHIARAYKIFKNKIKSIELCTNRFDVEVRNSFIDLYTKVDSGVNVDENGDVVEEPLPEVKVDPGF
jgi:AAA domain (dynein-related subfamily)